MSLQDTLDKVSGVTSGLGAILDSTKTPQVSTPSTQPRASGPVATKPTIPMWLVWVIGIGGTLLAVVIAVKFVKE